MTLYISKKLAQKLIKILPVCCLSFGFFFCYFCKPATNRASCVSLPKLILVWHVNFDTVRYPTGKQRNSFDSRSDRFYTTKWTISQILHGIVIVVETRAGAAGARSPSKFEKGLCPS